MDVLIMFACATRLTPAHHEVVPDTSGGYKLKKLYVRAVPVKARSCYDAMDKVKEHVLIGENFMNTIPVPK